MAGLFTFQWHYDPEGYEIRPDDHGDRAVIPKSAKTMPYRPFEIGTEKHVLFQIFAETPLSPDGYREFANRFGLLFKGDAEEPLHVWNVEINNMRQAVEAWQQGDLGSLVDIFNIQKFGQISVVLEPGAIPGERPKLRIRPVDLCSALWIQFAEAVAADLRIKHCDFCRTPFAFGPGTGRRGTATYCSPKCQKAHSYRKRLEAQK